MGKSDFEKSVDKANEALPTIINSNTLYREFIGMTKIEKVKEEDYVLKELVRGKTKAQILSELNEKHLDYSFTYQDLDKFLAKNPEVFRAMGKKVENSARRYLNAKADIAENMAGLIAYTQQLIPEFKKEGDNSNVVAAIRALQNSYMDLAKLEGFTKNDDNQVNVNIIQELSENKGRVKERIVDADYSVDEDE